MKKNYIFTLLLAFCISLTSFGQTTVFQESFETGNSGVASESCNDGSGDFFTTTDGSDISSAYQVSGQDGSFFFAAMDTDGSPCTMAMQTLLFDDVDISTRTDLTLALLLAEDQASDGKFDWDGGDLFYIEVDYDNSGSFTKVLQFATSADSGFNVSAPMQDTDFDGVGDGQALTDVFSEFTLSLGTGNLVDIRLVFDGLAAGDEDIAVDNIRIIEGFVAAPSLTISTPSNNEEFNPSITEVPVTFNISNFTLSVDNGSGVSDGSGDGYIIRTLEIVGEGSENADFFTLTPPAIEVSAGKSYVASAELVDNSGASLNPKVQASVSFSVATYTEVSTLAELRAGTEGDYYNLTGEVMLTYARSSRNQKYVQDATAGILIDDSAGTITTTYTTNDGITGLKGSLGSFGGVLQLIPDVDPGAASSNANTITTQVVTLADFVANFNDYESELITIENVSFATADVGTNFASSTNYDIESNGTTSIFRTNFSEADYIGTAIPSGTVNMTVLGAEFNGTPQVIAVNLDGLVLGASTHVIEGFTAYPNPVTNNQFTITSNSNDQKEVSIFNVIGKRVLSTSFVGVKSVVDVSSVASGLYILKVTEGTKTATSKLVIR